MDLAAALDQQIRRHVYDISVHRGSPPSLAELAAVTDSPTGAIRDSLARLAAARVFVLQRESGEILMAPPYSSVPTPFVVHTPRHSAYANCAWDALGVSVMQHEAVTVESACACCGEALLVDTREAGATQDNAVIHFAVPARHWWDDIVFT